MGVVVPLGEEREKGQSAVQALAGLVEADFAEVPIRYTSIAKNKNFNRAQSSPFPPEPEFCIAAFLGLVAILFLYFTAGGFDSCFCTFSNRYTLQRYRFVDLTG